MRILQTPHCDGCAFTIAQDDRTPLFDMLLPEELLLNGFDRADPIELLHIKPSIQTFDSVHCRAETELHFGGVSYFSRISHREEQLFDISISVRNQSGQTLVSPKLDVCQSMSNLPQGGWYNEEFLEEGVAVDRDECGRVWYTDVSIRRQRALSGWKWISIHPSPANPIIGEDVYPRLFGAQADCSCVGLENKSGTRTAFTAWSGPAYYRTPFPGNYCMHSLPSLPDLKDGDSFTVYGICGIYSGSFDALRGYLKERL